MTRVLAAFLLLFAGASLLAGDGPSVAPPPRAAARATNPLLGVWAGEGAVMVFEEKTLRVHLASGTDARSATLVVDYGITKDGMVFGIITREKLSTELELPKSSFVDETHRFRVFVDGNELTVKGVRLPVPKIAPELRVTKGGEKGSGSDAARDPLLMATIGLVGLEGHLAGTYERTTPEAIEKGRQSVPPPNAPPGSVKR
jgi:hypothetical protein